MRSTRSLRASDNGRDKSGMALLEIYNLTKVYDNSVVAINNFSFVYDKKSSTIVLIGPNGAGKTTLLRILAGQLRPTRGSVKIFDYDLVRDVDKIVSIVSFLPQGIRAPFYNLTPRDYVVSYLLIRGYSLRDARRRAREILELFSLEQYASVPVSKLSGGTIRRALIASVLADENAELFLLDEPLPGLDPRSRMVFWTVIRKVVGNGRLAIISSHYTEDIPLVADYVVVLSRGRKVAEGDPSNIIRDVMGNCSYKVIIKSNHSIGLVNANSVRTALNDMSFGICRIITLTSDTLIVYTSDPRYVVDIVEDRGLDVEVAPVGLGDIVLALGEK